MDDNREIPCLICVLKKTKQVSPVVGPPPSHRVLGGNTWTLRSFTWPFETARVGRKSYFVASRIRTRWQSKKCTWIHELIRLVFAIQINCMNLNGVHHLECYLGATNFTKAKHQFCNCRNCFTPVNLCVRTCVFCYSYASVQPIYVIALLFLCLIIFSKFCRKLENG